MNMEARITDVRFENHGSIILCQPLTITANEWIANHIPDDAQWYSGALVVEPRYVENIVDGMLSDGLDVEPDLWIGHPKKDEGDLAAKKER